MRLYLSSSGINHLKPNSFASVLLADLFCLADEVLLGAALIAEIVLPSSATVSSTLRTTKKSPVICFAKSSMPTVIGSA